jgi:hypothetical protein
MAMLATLEGENDGITLDDLFDVNDFLGVKMFGPENWNRIKKCVCIVTSKAAQNPLIFYIDSLKEEYPNCHPSNMSCALLGFNDTLGRRKMGPIPWDRLKLKIDNDVLNGPWGWVKSKVSDAASAVTEAAKTVINAPTNVLDYVTSETPLAILPTSQAYQYVSQKVLHPTQDAIKDAYQDTVDTGSEIIQYTIDKIPFSEYIPTLQMIKAGEEIKEEAGITSRGTAGVYETPEQEAARIEAERELQQKAAAAAAYAANVGSAKRAESLSQAKKKKQLTEQLTTAQTNLQQTQQNLDIMESRVTSRYAPLVITGILGLLALSIWKK